MSTGRERERERENAASGEEREEGVVLVGGRGEAGRGDATLILPSLSRSKRAKHSLISLSSCSESLWAWAGGGMLQRRGARRRDVRQPPLMPNRPMLPPETPGLSQRAPPEAAVIEGVRCSRGSYGIAAACIPERRISAAHRRPSNANAARQRSPFCAKHGVCSSQLDPRHPGT